MTKKAILFVCLGNICRSPAAEGIMKRLVSQNGLDGHFHIESAGIGGWHVGQLPDARMRKHGAAHGYTFDSRARQFADSDFDRFDLIVTMDHDNYRNIAGRAGTGRRAEVVAMADFLSHHPACSAIPDPYYGTDSDFELVIELLEDACATLFNTATKA